MGKRTSLFVWNVSDEVKQVLWHWYQVSDIPSSPDRRRNEATVENDARQRRDGDKRRVTASCTVFPDTLMVRRLDIHHSDTNHNATQLNRPIFKTQQNM